MPCIGNLNRSGLKIIVVEQGVRKLKRLNNIKQNEGVGVILVSVHNSITGLIRFGYFKTKVLSPFWPCDSAQEVLEASGQCSETGTASLFSLALPDTNMASKPSLCKTLLWHLARTSLLASFSVESCYIIWMIISWAYKTEHNFSWLRIAAGHRLLFSHIENGCI